MTNGNVSGGTALVNPAAPEIKHSLGSADNNSATTAATDHHMENVALLREEEKIVDEEVTSLEDNHEETSETSVERTMMTVAMMESVVHSSADTASVGTIVKGEVENPQCAIGERKDEESAQTGLRKRRRPSMNSEEGDATVWKPPLVQSFAPPLPTPVVPLPQKLSAPPPPLPNSVMSRLSVPPNAAAPPLPVPPPPVIPTTICSVPNPLAQIASPVAQQAVKASAINSAPVAAAVASIPCPLPSTALSAPEIKPVAVTSAPDFAEKRKVTIHEPPTSHRLRGLSIDMDLAFDLSDDASVQVGEGSDGPLAGGRDRAFSFECFAFGISADEPLPPLEHSSFHVQTLPEMGGMRPRGDSIIFDPSSFQDGGIHEQSALGRERARAPSIDAPKPRHLAQCNMTMTQSSIRPPVTVTSYSSAAVIPSVTPSSITVPSSSLSLELVNKDGRIGIYLPEARRARIARFHAKRARRIWRKRIKYDCRKKLADSRPRIKGRFVKRSDMDDE